MAAAQSSSSSPERRQWPYKSRSGQTITGKGKPYTKAQFLDWSEETWGDRHYGRRYWARASRIGASLLFRETQPNHLSTLKWNWLLRLGKVGNGGK